MISLTKIKNSVNLLKRHTRITIKDAMKSEQVKEEDH